MAVVHDFRPFALREDHFRLDINEEKEPQTALEAKAQAEEQAQQLGNKMRQRKKTSRRTDFS
jgi:hypothetical protein